MKAQKRQITSTLNVTTRDVSEHFQVLQVALQHFTKKRGAVAQSLKSVPHKENDVFSDLLARMNLYIARIQVVLSTKQSRCNMRVQIHLLSPWIPQYDRLMSNILRILNDRVSMLWRAKMGAGSLPSCLYASFVLHRDLLAYSTALKNAFDTLCPMQHDSKPSQQHQQQARASLQPSVASKSLICKISHCIRKVLPTMVVRVETHVAELVKESAKAILNRQSTEMGERFYCGGSGAAGGGVVSSLQTEIFSVTQTSLLASACCVVSCQRALAVTVGCCCDTFLDNILGKRLKFDEFGVLALHAQLEELLISTTRFKEDARLPVGVLIAQNQLSWERANGVLQLLLLATAKQGSSSRNRPLDLYDRSRGALSSYALPTAEQDAWLTLGRCQYFIECLRRISSCKAIISRKRSAIVSISPVLIIDNI